MLDFLAIFAALLRIFIDFGRTTARTLVQPMLMAAVMIGIYAAINIMQEGSIALGLKAAFLESQTDRLVHNRIDEKALLQKELRQFAAATKLIDQLLQTMLQQGGGSRARLAVIHNGVTGLTGTGLLRFDVTNSVSAKGREAGYAVINAPLADWSDFLPTLIAGHCSMFRVADLKSLPVRARLEQTGTSALMACPTADVQGKILGAAFVQWDENDPEPSGAELAALSTAEAHLSAQIAAVLDLQGPPPWPTAAPDSE
jgi:hypothetical protein